MTGLVIQLSFYFLLLFVCIKPLGHYIARIYQGKSKWLEPVLNPIEQFCYQWANLYPNQEMTWQQYAKALGACALGSFILLFLILKCQGILPLNPQHFPSLKTDLAFNIAASFVSNTNWQSYSGESTLSYFSQMIGLGVQNFMSASMGMAVMLAFIRGLTRQNTTLIGHFWADLLKSALYLFLPLSVILALLLGSQGVIQNFHSYAAIPLVEDPNLIQFIPGGPVASQVAIKQLGSNGGGFFNTNSAHPFENPTPFSNFLEMFSILLIPASLCYTFGLMVKDKRQGWALLATMTLLFLPLFFLGLYGELNAYFNLEGKEVRIGVLNSVLWSCATTATSNGSVNSMHESYSPLGGLAQLLLMQLGEVVYGGVGSGIYGIVIFVMITVFIAGLLVGRTPEYLGKKIDIFDIKMASLFILLPILLILFGSAFAWMTSWGKGEILNPGAHGFSEILYAFTSATKNNGSAFAGLTTNTPFYNITLGIIMLTGRFMSMVIVLAIAGNFATKTSREASQATFSTHHFLFIIMLVSTLLLICFFSFIPALVLGPIIEYLKAIA